MCTNLQSLPPNNYPTIISVLNFEINFCDKGQHELIQSIDSNLQTALTQCCIL